MYQPSPSSVTYISDLSELDDLKGNSAPLTDNADFRVNKYIRSPHGRPDSEYAHLAGMGRPIRGSFQSVGPQPQAVNSYVDTEKGEATNIFRDDESIISCQQIFKHIANCPLCQAYYKRDNRFLYILIIFLIVVVCYLCKKLYDLKTRK